MINWQFNFDLHTTVWSPKDIYLIKMENIQFKYLIYKKNNLDKLDFYNESKINNKTKLVKNIYSQKLYRTLRYHLFKIQYGFKILYHINKKLVIIRLKNSAKLRVEKRKV